MEWKYRCNLAFYHKGFSENKMTFYEYTKAIYDVIYDLINRIDDIDLKDELGEWLNDFGTYDNGEFVPYVYDNDLEELESRLNELYDIADDGKRIWFGM